MSQKRDPGSEPVAESEPHRIEIPHSITVKQLSDIMEVNPIEVIKQLMRGGVMANINQTIDFDTASIIASDFGFEAGLLAKETRGGYQRFGEEDTSLQRPRPSVVTIMGHVDHGKTSLLDAIRQTNVIATEAGSITQHIGAYQVEVNGQRITFLDTPGHEAFTAMRARGAQVTDIAVIVIAADDGMMPQTIEAIDHARAADVPILVAINKIDKPEANPERVKRQLAEKGILIEEWGGDTICVSISAKKRQGIEELLENLLTLAEVMELKANPRRRAIGAIIEAKLDKTKGPLATALIQAGTLKIGDSILAGDTWGRVKAMFNERAKHLRKAEPATPVEIMGLNGVPQVGDTIMAVASDREARSLVQKHHEEKQRGAIIPQRALTLDELFTQIQAGQIRELNIILKTDVQGTIEPIKGSLERLGTEKLRVKVIHSTSGTITESDVMLAIASKGIIIGFNTTTEPGAKRLAEAEGVDIRYYSVIYNLIDDIDMALKGMLQPTYTTVVEGHGEVRAIFSISKKGKAAGVYVTDGKLTRGAQARIMRDGDSVFESTISSLKRFTEDVTEVLTGFECGVGIEGYKDLQIGDIIEAYRKHRG